MCGEIGLRHHDRYRSPAVDSPGYEGALSVGRRKRGAGSKREDAFRRNCERERTSSGPAYGVARYDGVCAFS